MTTTRLRLVVAGMPALADALAGSGAFEQVHSVTSTGGLRDLISSGLNATRQELVFLFADNLRVDTPQTPLPVLLQKLTGNGYTVIVAAVTPNGADLVSAYPAAGLMQGPFTVNTTLGAISGTGVANIPRVDGGDDVIPVAGAVTTPPRPVAVAPAPATPVAAAATGGGWATPAAEAPVAVAPRPVAPQTPVPQTPVPRAPAARAVAPQAPGPQTVAAAPQPQYQPNAEQSNAEQGWPTPTGAPIIPTEATQPARRSLAELAQDPTHAPSEAPAPSVPEPQQAPSGWETAAQEAATPATAGGWQAPADNDGGTWGKVGGGPVARAGSYQAQHAQPARRGYVITVTVPKGGAGKAIDLDESVPTPTGWARFGDLGVGDEVFDERGDVCSVIALSEIWQDRACFEITFSDGASVIADGAHEWSTRDGTTGTSQIRTTAEIAHSTPEHTPAAPLTGADVGERRHAIVNTEPLQLADADLAIDPYVLGTWLGDDNTSTPTAGPSVVGEVRFEGYEASDTTGPARLLGSEVGLADLGVAPNKHIPTTYLRASFKQRLALLQGLMDTAGTADGGGGHCAFTTTTTALTAGFVELARTLGSKPVVEKRDSGVECDHRPEWVITFVALEGVPPFRHADKAELVMAHQVPRLLREIVSCQPVAPRATRCIEVSSTSHLFLVGIGMVPTHNSSLTLNLAAYMGLRMRALGKTVCVIDTNFQQADIGKYLNAYNPNITDLVRDQGLIHKDRIASKLLHRPDLNMSALLGPATPVDANPLWINARLYCQCLVVLRQLYDYVFIDTPVAELYHDIFRDFALPEADYILVPVAPNYPTIMNTDAWLGAVTTPRLAGGAGVDPEKVGIVLNRAQDDIGCSEEEVRVELAQWQFIGAIPETKEWQRANNLDEIVATKNYAELNEAFARILYAATGEESLLEGMSTLTPTKEGVGSRLKKLLGLG